MSHSGGTVYGQKAKDLLMELKGAEALPAYNDELVRAILAETSALESEIEKLQAEQAELPSDVGLKVPFVVYDATVKRNKRCLMAYHHRRCDFIDELRWTFGPSGLPAEIKDKMSRAEADYFQAYSDALTRFVASTGVDITSDVKPPMEDYLEVVALRDCGRLMTMSGPRDVREKEVHLVRKYDAEPLIRMGWLRHVAGRA